MSSTDKFARSLLSGIRVNPEKTPTFLLKGKKSNTSDKKRPAQKNSLTGLDFFGSSSKKTSGSKLSNQEELKEQEEEEKNQSYIGDATQDGTDDESYASDASEGSGNDSDDDLSLFSTSEVDKKRAAEKQKQKREREALDAISAKQAALAAFKKQMGIKMRGSAPPDPQDTFGALVPETLPQSVIQDIAAEHGYSAESFRASRHTQVRNHLLKCFEESAFKEPTAVQMAAIPCLLRKRDTLAIAPTGSGKTVAFLAPIIAYLHSSLPQTSSNYDTYGPRALILSPTKELAAQTAREARRLTRGLGFKTILMTKNFAQSTVRCKLSAHKDAVGLAQLPKKGEDSKRGKGKNKAARKDDSTKQSNPKKSKGRGKEEEEDDVLRWSDDEDLDATPSVEGSDAENSGDEEEDLRLNELSASDLAEMQQSASFRCDILVSTPLVLAMMLRKQRELLQAKAEELGIDADSLPPLLSRLSFLVLDECDSLLHGSFAQQVDELLSFIKGDRARAQPQSGNSKNPSKNTPSKASVRSHSLTYGFFSATMPSSVEDTCVSLTTDPIRVTIGLRGGAANTIEQKVVYCGREDGKLLALKQLKIDGVKPPVLVFTQDKKRAEDVTRALRMDFGSLHGGPLNNIICLHADKTEKEREQAITALRRGEVLFLVTTDLLGRGIDAKSVSTVINFDLPLSGSEYIHRIGRTGRGGRKGTAITYFTEDDIVRMRSIANVMKLSGADVPDWLLTVKPQTQREKKKAMRAPPKRHMDPLLLGKTNRKVKKRRTYNDASGADSDGQDNEDN